MKYFTEQELCRSNTAERLHIYNWPTTDEIWDALYALTDNILDPARERLGKAIYVNSGYRSLETNISVGGTKNSQHMRGEAADIYCEGSLKLLFDILKTLDFDQLIWYRKKNFIHVSYTTRRPNRHQIIYN